MLWLIYLSVRILCFLHLDSSLFDPTKLQNSVILWESQQNLT